MAFPTSTVCVTAAYLLSETLPLKYRHPPLFHPHILATVLLPPLNIEYSAPSVPSATITMVTEDSIVITFPFLASTLSSVVAVLSTSTISFVLSNGDSSESSNEVSCLGLSLPHLVWRATVWSSEDIQVPVDTPLDDGAHLALVRPDFVDLLKLPIHKLSKPLSVTVALQDTPTFIKLSDYVALSLSSLNNAWTS